MRTKKLVELKDRLGNTMTFFANRSFMDEIATDEFIGGEDVEKDLKEQIEDAILDEREWDGNKFFKEKNKENAINKIEFLLFEISYRIGTELSGGKPGEEVIFEDKNLPIPREGTKSSTGWTNCISFGVSRNSTNYYFLILNGYIYFK